MEPQTGGELSDRLARFPDDRRRPLKLSYFFKRCRRRADQTPWAAPAAVVRMPGGEMAAFLWRMAGRPSASAEAGFIDVDRSVFYAVAVDWLLQD